MKKRKFNKSAILGAIICATMMLFLFTACEKRIGLSKNMLIANTTDVMVRSVTLDVDDGSLEEPIALLGSDLEPGEVREVHFSAPKKQAEKGNWFVFALTEDGADLSAEFEVGEFNPHGDSADISCFAIYWNEDKAHYSVRV